MNTKKIAAIIVFGLTTTTCATPAVGQATNIEYTTVATTSNPSATMEQHRIKQTQLEKEAAAAIKLAEDTALMNKALKKLNQYVGKTWYVFSGATPGGWDCSGLTMWFYEQLDISIEHRATKQAKAGSATTDPKPGDIVVFTYKGSKSAYHVGIYIGDGKMIHAPKHGHVTRIESIDQFAGDYSKVTYRTLLKTI